MLEIMIFMSQQKRTQFDRISQVDDLMKVLGRGGNSIGDFPRGSTIEIDDRPLDMVIDQVRSSFPTTAQRLQRAENNFTYNKGDQCERSSLELCAHK